MKKFTKVIPQKERSKITENWITLYNDYCNFDNRAVKIVKYRDNNTKFVMEHIEGILLSDLKSVKKLELSERRFILDEFVDIYWTQFKFKHEFLNLDDIFIHNDFYLDNLVYSNGKVRLIDPDSFTFSKISLYNNIHYGKFIESLTILIQIIGDTDEKITLQ